MKIKKQNVEQWAAMEEGPWLISDQGRMCLTVDRGGKHGNFHKAGKLIKFQKLRNPGVSRKYLGVVLTCWDGTKKMIRPSTMVAKYFIGPRPPNMTINHKDGDKNNNAVSNLEYVTHLENMNHAAKTGLLGVWRKVSDKEVVQMRKLYSERDQNGLSLGDLAVMFGIEAHTVYLIATRRRRQHVA